MSRKRTNTPRSGWAVCGDIGLDRRQLFYGRYYCYDGLDSDNTFDALSTNQYSYKTT